MNKTTWAFLIIKVTQGLGAGWFFGTYVLFLLGHGFTLEDCNRLNLVFMGVSFVCSFLAGPLADRLGRKRIYLWGQVLWGMGMLIYGIGQTFLAFVLAEAIGAVGGAFMSDSLEAWLRNNTNESLAHKTISRAGALVALSTILPASLGGILGEVLGLEWPWLMSAMGSFVAAAIAYFLLRDLSDGDPSEQKESLPPWFQTFVQSLRTTPLRIVFLVTFLASAAFAPFNMFWAPVLEEVSGAAWWLGFMWVGIALASAFGSYLVGAGRLKLNGLGIAFSLLAAGIPMALAPWFPTAPFLVGTFLLHEVGRGALPPLLFTYSNRHIPDRTRATVNSLRSVSRTLGAALGLFVSGRLTRTLSPLDIWGLSAMALILTALYVWRRNLR